MPEIDEARSIAEAFVSARRKATALTDYPGTEPGSLAAALAIQAAAIPMFGEAVAGWKVGRIHSPWLEQIGADRLLGPIFASKVQHIAPGANATGHIFQAGFGAAEAEFVFRLGNAPADGVRHLSLADAADLVDAVFIGIEIASSPFAGINIRGPLVTISDFGNNNGLIVGQEIPDWRSADLDNWTITASIDGQYSGQGQALTFPDGLLGSVRFLVESLLSRGIAIEPGLLISTGAVSGVHEITAGQKFEAEFGNFGKIDCEMAFATA